MENKTEKIYSHSANEAQELLNRRRSSDNGAEIASMIYSTGNIIKSFHDGYISKEDIENRKVFMDNSFYRESLLTTSLGLLEKSRDPNAKKQIESARRLLAVIRSCRANIIKNTPPRNIAKRIQKRQEERNEKIANGLSPQTALESSDSNFIPEPSPFKSPFKLTPNPKQNQSNALLAAIFLAGLDGKFLQESMKKAENSTDKKTLDNESLMIFDAFNLLREQGFKREDLSFLAKANLADFNDAAKIRETFIKNNMGELDFTILQGVKDLGFAQSLRDSIINSNIIMPNIYDYSMMNPIINRKIDDMSKEDLIAHQKHMLAQKTMSANTQEQTATQSRTSFSVDNFYKKSNYLGRD